MLPTNKIREEAGAFLTILRTWLRNNHPRTGHTVPEMLEDGAYLLLKDPDDGTILRVQVTEAPRRSWDVLVKKQVDQAYCGRS